MARTRIQELEEYIEECSDLITIETFKEIAQKEFAAQQGESMPWNQKNVMRFLHSSSKLAKPMRNP
jgi:hypothetical protein